MKTKSIISFKLFGHDFLGLEFKTNENKLEVASKLERKDSNVKKSSCFMNPVSITQAFETSAQRANNPRITDRRPFSNYSYEECLDRAERDLAVFKEKLYHAIVANRANGRTFSDVKNQRDSLIEKTDRLISELKEAKEVSKNKQTLFKWMQENREKSVSILQLDNGDYRIENRDSGAKKIIPKNYASEDNVLKSVTRIIKKDA